jgi:prolipoprotein diacylglyceryl transferase
MLPILQIGPLAVQTPGLIILLSVWAGLTLAERYAGGRKINPDQIYNLTLVGMIAGVLGARLVYAARYSAAFSANPASLFSLNPGLLDPLGGIATGLIAGLIYGQRARLPFWRTVDALTPALAVVSIGLGLSQLAAGNAYGAPTNLPWGIELWGAVRHPTQIYNALAGAIILIFIWPGRRGLASLSETPGTIFLSFIALTGGARLFLEAYRADSAILPSGIRSAQVIAWLVLAASLWALTRIRSISSSTIPAGTPPAAENKEEEGVGHG